MTKKYRATRHPTVNTSPVSIVGGLCDPVDMWQPITQGHVLTGVLGRAGHAHENSCDSSPETCKTSAIFYSVTTSLRMFTKWTALCTTGIYAGDTGYA